MVVKVGSSIFFPSQVVGESPIDVAKLGGVVTISLDADTAQSTNGWMIVKGTWNASTNTPTLASGVGTKGFAYFVSVAGSTSIDGVSAWSIGDIITFDGTIWRKISASGATLIPAVNITDSTVAGRAVLTAADAATQRTALGLATVAASGAFSDLANRPSPEPSGRPTFTSGVPILSSPVTGAVAVYFSPYRGNTVPIWNGTSFSYHTASELVQALSDSSKSPNFAEANKIYDLFRWDDAGTERCTRGPYWTSDTARGTGAGTTELELVDGFWVNKFAISNGPGARLGTYVGSFRTNGTATVDFTPGSAAAGGGEAKLNIWSAYNRVHYVTQVSDSNAAHAYTSATWREYDSSTAMRVNALVGIAEDAVEVEFASLIGAAAAAVRISVALNSITVPGKLASVAIASSSITTTVATRYAAKSVLGYNYYQALESGGAGGTLGGSDLAYMTYRSMF